MIEIRSRDSDTVLLRLPLDTLAGADLARLALTGADLAGADLQGTDIRGADLCKARLSGADLRGARLDGADLTLADCSTADLTGAHLADAMCIAVTFCDKSRMRRLNFRQRCLEAVTSKLFFSISPPASSRQARKV